MFNAIDCARDNRAAERTVMNRAGRVGKACRGKIVNSDRKRSSGPRLRSRAATTAGFPTDLMEFAVHSVVDQSSDLSRAIDKYLSRDGIVRSARRVSNGESFSSRGFLESQTAGFEDRVAKTAANAESLSQWTL